jgi:phage terminase large subunit-like protein
MAAAKEGWNFSCPDWKERLKSGTSLVPELPLDAKEAARAIAIFNRLRLPDVPGNPMLADSGGSWVRELVAPVFGSIDAAGVRHVGEFLAMVPKKNIKTTGGAALMLTGMLAEDPQRSRNQQFHLYGPTQPIAELAYFQALGMIRADPEGYLQKRFHPREHLKSIVDLATNNELRVKTFDMKISTGTIPKGVLVDELHILGSMHFAQRVIGQIRGGLISRKDSFLGFITTQSDEVPAGAFRAELMLARAIRDGRVSGLASRMLPLLYEFPEEVQASGDWREPKLWHMVNPNLGHSVTIDRLEADWAQAQEKGEEEVRRWASQHLNVEIGLALHSDRWRGADLWEDATDPILAKPGVEGLKALLERCEVVVAGIDGGGLDDLMGLCVAGREKGSKRWLFWFRAWAWSDVLERRKEIEPILRDLEKAGDVVILTAEEFVAAADGEDEEAPVEQDVAEIVEILEMVRDSGLLPDKGAIGCDPAAIGGLVDALAEAELTDPQVVAVSQGWSLSSAIYSMERKLRHKTMAHGGQPLMAWCVGNARAQLRGKNVYIDKSAAGKAKIDPLMAGFNAAKLLETNPEAVETGLQVFV